MGKTVLLIGVFLMLWQQSLGEQHVVGWDESTDFDLWASGQTFKVGDTLVFKYSPMHSVAELGSESAYKNCDVGTATNSMSDGNSVVKLTKAGTRYFACGTAGHCGQGMKVKVTTVSASSSSSSNSNGGTTSNSSVTCFPGSFVLLLGALTNVLF